MSSEIDKNTCPYSISNGYWRLEWEENPWENFFGGKKKTRHSPQIVKEGMIKTKEHVFTNTRGKC